jgi:release factor glutamine methyltransferase
LTIRQAYQQLLQTLTPVWGAGEARATARALFEDAFNRMRPADDEDLLRPEEALRLNSYTQRLMDCDEPLAYLTGVAHFAGLKLAVSPAVLIPRPETEEWVYRVVQDWAPLAGPDGSYTRAGIPLHALEVGTGSGCIALALARDLPGLRISALDISPEALALAERNAEEYGIAVHFLQGDFLDPVFRNSLPNTDLLLSNPPYIDPRERPDLERRVREYEPSLALFGPAGDPLAFYAALGDFAHQRMQPLPHVLSELTQAWPHPGASPPQAYLETSALSAAQALQRWEVCGWKDRLEKDLSGRDRLLLGWPASA